MLGCTVEAKGFPPALASLGWGAPGVLWSSLRLVWALLRAQHLSIQTSPTPSLSLEGQRSQLLAQVRESTCKAPCEGLQSELVLDMRAEILLLGVQGEA